LGSKVLLRAEILSEDNLVTIDLLRALENSWSAKCYRPSGLCRSRMWGITKDRQGYHHPLPTLQPRGMKQMKVTSSLDTTSTLFVTTLANSRPKRWQGECGHTLGGASLHCLHGGGCWLDLGLVLMGMAPRIYRCLGLLPFLGLDMLYTLPVCVF